MGDADMEKRERGREDMLVGSRVRGSGLFMVKGRGDLVRESKMWLLWLGEGKAKRSRGWGWSV